MSVGIKFDPHKLVSVGIRSTLKQTEETIQISCVINKTIKHMENASYRTGLVEDPSSEARLHPLLGGPRGSVQALREVRPQSAPDLRGVARGSEAT